MSLYASYVKEREGHSLIEESWGFIEYSLVPPICLIHSIYIKEEARKERRATELANLVTLRAKESGCTTLWSQVWAPAFNSTLSLKAILAYGFTVQKAENDRIILTKDITEVKNG